jgi:hypothetical protein
MSTGRSEAAGSTVTVTNRDGRWRRPGATASRFVALADRAQHRCRGARAWPRLLWRDGHRRQARLCRPDVTVTKRDGVMAPAWCIGGPHRGDGAGTLRCWRWPERVPWAGGADRPAADRGTPLMLRARGTPYAHRAQPEQIYRDRNSSPAEPAGYSLPGNGPFLLKRRLPGRNSVIAGCVTSRNTRGGDGWWSAQVGAVDHAACCIWSALQASSASSRSTGAPARPSVCRARLMSWAVGGPS